MRVFISHGGVDAPLARRVADVLRQAGLDVWLDAEQILPGDDWGARISEALRHADAMVVLLTPTSLGSSSINYEIDYALGNAEYKDRLIPVLVGPREQLKSIPWILNRLRTIHVAGSSNEDLQEIADAVLAAA